ncbi:MAG: hypothetical protein U1F87_10805 [Kiritimatiellia bacterium]
MTGAILQSNNGVSDAGGSQLEWNRTSVNVLGSATTLTIAGRIRMREDYGYTGILFDVADGAAATDLAATAAITEAAGGMGITKNGPGTWSSPATTPTPAPPPSTTAWSFPRTAPGSATSPPWSWPTPPTSPPDHRIRAGRPALRRRGLGRQHLRRLRRHPQHR